MTRAISSFVKESARTRALGRMTVTRNLQRIHNAMNKDPVIPSNETSMYSMRLRRADHTRHYSIQAKRGTGWEVSLKEDQVLTRHALYDDWHRVERALALFRREVANLSTEGWEPAGVAAGD